VHPAITVASSASSVSNPAMTVKNPAPLEKDAAPLYEHPHAFARHKNKKAFLIRKAFYIKSSFD